MWIICCFYVLIFSTFAFHEHNLSYECLNVKTDVWFGFTDTCTRLIELDDLQIDFKNKYEISSVYFPSHFDANNQKELQIMIHRIYTLHDYCETHECEPNIPWDKLKLPLKLAPSFGKLQIWAALQKWSNKDYLISRLQVLKNVEYQSKYIHTDDDDNNNTSLVNAFRYHSADPYFLLLNSTQNSRNYQIINEMNASVLFEKMSNDKNYNYYYSRKLSKKLKFDLTNDSNTNYNNLLPFAFNFDNNGNIKFYKIDDIGRSYYNVTDRMINDLIDKECDINLWIGSLNSVAHFHFDGDINIFHQII